LKSKDYSRRKKLLVGNYKEKQYDLKKAVSKKKLQGLIRVMHGYVWKYLGATAAITVSSIGSTAQYFILQYFIDDYLSNRTAEFGLFAISSSLVVLTLIRGIGSFFSGKWATETSEGVTKRLRDFLFNHIEHLPYTYHNENDTGELIQRVTSDVDALRMFFSNNAIGVARTLILFIVNFVAIGFLNWRLAWMSIIAIPVIVLISALFFKQISKAYEAYQVKEASLSTTLQENLAGVRVVKAFARQTYEINKFERNNIEKYTAGLKLNRMHAFFWPISDVICSAQIILGYLIGGTMAMNGEITIGTYLAYTGMIIWIIFPMRNLGRLIVEMSRGFVSFDRVAKIINETREPLEEGDYLPDQIEGKVEFEQVSFSYEDGFNVLDDISFTINAGQSIALIGSTGSGKTTLVNLIPRFFDYTNGSIKLDNIELQRYPRTFLRKHIGIVEQEPFLFSRSIRDNIRYGVNREVTEEEMIEAAKAAAVHDVIMEFPNQYDTMVGERGVTLSGGQKQRVAIARTLLKNPKILIMDDSTSSVDTETESLIREALNNLMENRTTFSIAHRIQSIMNADLILVLDKSRIVQSGTHEELIAQDGIYRNIFDIQTKIEEDLQKEIESVS
jgi:ATP-binding cassette subfamily B protein